MILVASHKNEIRPETALLEACRSESVVGCLEIRMSETPGKEIGQKRDYGRLPSRSRPVFANGFLSSGTILAVLLDRVENWNILAAAPVPQERVADFSAN